MGEWEEFIERLLARLHDLHAKDVKADVLVMLGRYSKTTGKKLLPKMQIREFE